MRDMKQRLDPHTIKTYRKMFGEDREAFIDGFLELHSNEQYQILRILDREELEAVFAVISPETFAQYSNGSLAKGS